MLQVIYSTLHFKFLIKTYVVWLFSSCYIVRFTFLRKILTFWTANNYLRQFRVKLSCLEAKSHSLLSLVCWFQGHQTKLWHHYLPAGCCTILCGVYIQTLMHPVWIILSTLSAGCYIVCPLHMSQCSVTQGANYNDYYSNLLGQLFIGMLLNI